MGTVYHYRLESVYGGARSYALYSNGEFVTRIGNGGYYAQYLKPGKHEYKEIDRANAMGVNFIGTSINNSTAKAKHVYTLTVAPNEVYFLRWSHQGEVEIMQEEIALRELEGLKEFSPKEKRIWSDPAIPTSLE